MLSLKRIAFVLALIGATSVSLILVTALSKGKTAVSASSKVKVLRRKDQKHVKPTAAELAASFPQQTKEERKFEDEIPKHVPIKWKFKADKEKQFKDLDNPGWYRDFELEVTNTSDKPIYFLELWLVYPEIIDNGRAVGVPLRYGRMNFIYHDTQPLPTDVPIKPGETHLFTIPEKARKGWEWHKKNENTPDPKKVVVKFVQLSFGDGTGFSGTDAKAYPYKRGKTSALPCREGPAQGVVTGPVSYESYGLQVTHRNDLFFPITGRLSAGYFSAFNKLFIPGKLLIFT